MRATLIAMMLFTALTADASAAGSCSGQRAICNAFCKQNPERTMCSGDCASRYQSCLNTGSFYWINRPTAVGLIRK